MALRDEDLRDARPGQKLYALDDEAGLYLVVTPKGEKVWRFRFIFNGEDRILFLGRYPDVSLADARGERDVARAFLRDRRDPWLEMRKRRREREIPAGTSAPDVMANEGKLEETAPEETQANLRARGTPPRIVLGPKLFGISGRHITLFGPSMLQKRERAVGQEFFVLSQDEAGQPLARSFTAAVDLPVDRLGSTAVLKLTSRATDPLEITFPLAIGKSDATKVGSPIFLMIGDSTTAGTQQVIGNMLTKTAVTPTWIGTRRWDGTTIDGEGRASWRAVDFIHADDKYGPLPPGDEQAARASATDDRNPFIRAATEADDPAIVRNGHVFDFRFYLDRFGFADPTAVTIALGINDIGTDGLMTGVQSASTAIAIIVGQIKAAAPACRIGLAVPMIGNHQTYNHHWELGLAPLLLDHLSRYAADPQVDIINTHAAMPDRLIFPTKPIETDTVTGQSIDRPTDRTHATATPIGAALYAEQIVAFFHAMA
ncbi:integrase arm-type DNA-binding domain-containing protein [Sphingomonas sp. TZW2008]|uniref:integrase arm-type DNA-binding domain-containing protein n=1 Tax=Sphingomonas sp. TZW2008 TaxID=1917973 RepID=UPI000A268B48|nr:integrase arm-type DNA-binding domain-containing protein [Sphingomonas sp. TZW2008]